MVCVFFGQGGDTKGKHTNNYYLIRVVLYWEDIIALEEKKLHLDHLKNVGSVTGNLALLSILFLNSSHRQHRGTLHKSVILLFSGRGENTFVTKVLLKIDRKYVLSYSILYLTLPAAPFCLAYSVFKTWVTFSDFGVTHTLVFIFFPNSLHFQT